MAQEVYAQKQDCQWHEALGRLGAPVQEWMYCFGPQDEPLDRFEEPDTQDTADAPIMTQSLVDSVASQRCRLIRAAPLAQNSYLGQEE